MNPLKDDIGIAMGKHVAEPCHPFEACCQVSRNQIFAEQSLEHAAIRIGEWTWKSAST
jgi:hypothetical protein